MSRFFSRVVGNYDKEKMVIQCKVNSYNAETAQGFSQVYVEWSRGDKVTRTNSKGPIVASGVKMLNVTTKLDYD